MTHPRGIHPARHLVATAVVISLALTGSAIAQPGPPTGAAVACDGIVLADVRGTAPASARPLATFPNDHAVCDALWIPLLDSGTIPQGLALLGDGTGLISGHVNSSRSTARIMRMDLTTGALIAGRDIPKGGHAGGIEVDDSGGVWVASTNKLLYWQSVADIFSDAPRKVRISTNTVDEPFKASFITSGVMGRVWIGSHQTAELLEFSTSLLASAVGTTRSITRADALSVIDIVSEPEGAVFGSDLIVSSSKSVCGVLSDASSRVGFGPGAQQIELEGDGSLWSIFQAGTARYPDAPYFPVVARFDPSLLVDAAGSRCSSFGI
jgi:hypothetical protein